MANLHQLLKAMVEKGASRPPHHDRLAAAAPHRRRADAAQDATPLSPQDTKQLCYSVLTDAQKHRSRRTTSSTSRSACKGLARFRANVFMQRGAVAGAFRAIPFKILTFEELGLPPVVEELCEKPRGLVLVTGPDRLGQVDHARVDDRQDQHRATTTTSSRSRTRSSSCTSTRTAWSTSARSARDTQSFKNALKYILRQDPDVVLVGEMRDLETIEAALTIAETGHLVLRARCTPTRACRRSTASSTCSRRTSSRRSARSSRSCSRA